MKAKLVSYWRLLRHVGLRLIRTMRLKLLPSRQIGEQTHLISVIIPLYNEETYIVSCLKSIKNQNYQHFECLVIDDCSSDGSVALVEEFIRNDSRFHLISHDRNMGLPSARNTGLKASKGRFITFLDSDDYLYQNSLLDRANALEAEETDTGVAGSYSHIRSVPQEGGGWRDIILPYYFKTAGKITFLSKEGECPFPAHAPLLRRDIMVRLGGFDERLTDGCEDWDCWQRLLRTGYCLVSSSNVGGAYRVRRKSMRLAAPYAHTNMAIELIERAYHPAAAFKDAVGDENSWPYFYAESLADYRKQLLEIKRLIRSISLALFNDNKEEYKMGLKRLPRKSWPWLRHHLNLRSQIDDHLFMAIGLDRDKRTQQHKYHDQMASQLVQEITQTLAEDCE